jgi:hypothetical protein
VVGVGVRVDALEVRPIRELERFELRELGQDAVPARTDLFALAMLDEERLFQRSGS